MAGSNATCSWQRGTAQTNRRDVSAGIDFYKLEGITSVGQSFTSGRAPSWRLTPESPIGLGSFSKSELQVSSNTSWSTAGHTRSRDLFLGSVLLNGSMNIFLKPLIGMVGSMQSHSTPLVIYVLSAPWRIGGSAGLFGDEKDLIPTRPLKSGVTPQGTVTARRSCGPKSAPSCSPRSGFQENGSRPRSSAIPIGRPSPTGPVHLWLKEANYHRKSNRSYKRGAPDFSTGTWNYVETTGRGSLNPGFAFWRGVKGNSSVMPRKGNGLMRFSSMPQTIRAKCEPPNTRHIGIPSGLGTPRPPTPPSASRPKTRPVTSKR